MLDALNGKIVANGMEDSVINTKGFEYGELYCFDNSYKVDFDNFSVVFELTCGGLMVHMNSEDAIPKNMEILEKYARKVFNDTPEQHFDDKYLWYLEIERFKKLPFYNEMNNEMFDIINKKNSNELEVFYKKLLNMLNDLIEYKQKSSTTREKIIIEEIGAAVNLILDAMLPMGYALRKCYFDSIQLLEKYNMNFNDLFINQNISINDKKLLKIKDFLNTVAVNRNEIYGKICSIGATSPEYFELRNDNLIKRLGYENMDIFYDSLNDEDLSNVELIMAPYFIAQKITI